MGAGRLIKQGKGWQAKWKERWFEFDAAGDRLLFFDMGQGKKQEAEPEGGGGQALLRSTLSEMSVGLPPPAMAMLRLVGHLAVES